MSRFALTLGLNEAERQQLRSHGEHDRLLREASAGPFGDAVELLSAALLAHERHGPLARQGLVHLLRRAADSGQGVIELERLAHGVPHAQGEAHMT